MENESQFDELLIRYLSNETSQSEGAAILEWIQADVQNRQRFEEMQGVWRLVGVQKEAGLIDVEREWEQFKTTANNRWLKTVPLSQSEPVYPEIEEKHFIAAHRMRNRIKVAVAVAASAVIVFGMIWMMEGQQKESGPALVKAITEMPDKPQVVTVHEKNTSGVVRHLILQDGSEILLANNSEVTYRQPFADGRRDITLFGKAEFRVSKDMSKPFTVYSGDILTTVLGTDFSVTYFKGGSQIIVALYAGKVVVRAADTMERKLKKDYYLLPGQQLLYNQKDYSAVLKRMTRRRQNDRNQINGYDLSKDDPTIPKGEGGSWYMFNNQSLAQVFNQLADMYGIPIDYSADDVRNKYFIGKFGKTDSLETILKQIAVLNNLTVLKEANKYVIRK